MNSVDLSLSSRVKGRILKGGKSAVLCMKEIGVPGDTFMIDGQVFQITKVLELDLYTVITEYYSQEGFTSPGAFSRYWLKEGPSIPWNGTEMVFLHLFRRCSGDS